MQIFLPMSDSPSKLSSIVPSQDGQEVVAQPTLLLEGTSVRERWSGTIVLVSWILFVAYEVLIGLDHNLRRTPLCLYKSSIVPFPTWYNDVQYAVLGGFAAIYLALFFQVLEFVFEKRRWPSAPLFLAFHAVSIALASIVAAAVWNVGGLCVDMLGVTTQAAVWGMWFTSGPIVVFITLTIIDRSSLSRLEWLTIAGVGLGVASGFVVLVPQPSQSAEFFLALAFALFSPSLALPCLRWGREHGPQARRWRAYSLLLLLLFGLFGLNYLLSVFDVTSSAFTLSAFQVLSVITLGLFPGAATGTLGLSSGGGAGAEPSGRVSETGHAAKGRQLMDWIHRDLKEGALKALNKGMDGLASADNDNAVKEATAYVRGATEFLSHTMRVLLSMKRMEDGEAVFRPRPMCLESVVRRACAEYKGLARTRNLEVNVTISHHFPGLPESMLGDAALLEHGLSQLLSSAVKRSLEHKAVTVGVECLRTVPSGDVFGQLVAYICVSVACDGSPVLRAEDALLGFCRRIVELHKGSLEVRGARVSFTIPFPVVAGTPVKRAAVEDAAVPSQALGLGMSLGGGAGIGDGQVGLLLKTDAPLSFSLPGASTPFAAAAPAWGLSLSLSSDSTSMAPAPPLFNLADMQPLALTPAVDLTGYGTGDREQHHHQLTVEEHKQDVEAGVPNLLDFSADWSQQFLRNP